MKKILITFAGILLTLVCVVYGPSLVYSTFVPPERGYYRYYETVRFDGPVETYWVYLRCNGALVSVEDLQQDHSSEKWELISDRGVRYFLYDGRNEFAGVARFSRYEMRVTYSDGGEQRFPRVMSWWELWRSRAFADGHRSTETPLVEQRAGHLNLIASRAKAKGLSVSPSAVAQLRPPARLPVPRSVRSRGAAPLLVIMDYGYRNDTGPVLAVYADGTVLCRSLPENRASPYHRLQVPNAARFVRETLGNGFYRHAEKVTLSEATDSVTTTIWTPERTVRIYGNWRKPDTLGLPNDAGAMTVAEREFSERMKQRWDMALAGLRGALIMSDEMRRASGERWLPDSIEVVFNSYEHARDTPLEWPEEWPGLYANTSIYHGDGVYSVFVPAKDFLRLREFLDRRGERAAIMISLNQMYGKIRFPFPGEEIWEEN